MKKLLQLSLLTYYKNWVMWLTIIGLEIIGDVYGIYNNLFYYYDKQGNINPEKALEAIKGYGVEFDSSVTLISILLLLIWFLPITVQVYLSDFCLMV